MVEYGTWLGRDLGVKDIWEDDGYFSHRYDLNDLMTDRGTVRFEKY